MSIWNKILLGCIFVAALVLFALTARALQARRIWADSYKKHQDAIEAAQQQIEELKPPLREARLELYKLLIGRGRVWDGCVPSNVEKGDDPTATTPRERVLVTLDMPAPDALEAGLVLYAFEEKPASDGGNYMGQYTVTDVVREKAILRPSVRLSDAEFARVQASQQESTPWRLYELMPSDSHEVLAELTDEEIKAMFPTGETLGEEYATANDYIYDGQIITKTKADQLGLNGRVVMVDEAGEPVRNEEGLYTEVTGDAKGKFLRTLRDYEVQFNEDHRIRAKTIDRLRVVQRDLQFLEESFADSQIQKQTRQKEIRALKQGLAEASAERDAVVSHEQKLTAAIASMQKAIEALIARNEAAIARVARIQKNAAQIINNRTAGVVESTRPQPVRP